MMSRPASPDYRHVRELQGALGGRDLTYSTRPGFADWEGISPSLALIADNAEVPEGSRASVSPCGHGALGAWAALQTPSASVALHDTNVIATQVAQETLRLNGVQRATVETGPPPSSAGSQDVVLMGMPKGRDLARLYLLAALRALSPGGALYLTGPTRGGIKSVIADAELLYGPATLLRYKGRARLARFTRPMAADIELPDVFRAPGLSEGTYASLAIDVNGVTCHVSTRPGVFSWRHLDPGTELLLNTLRVRPDDVALDLGCGYGIIGVVVAGAATLGSVTLVDVDALACDCARVTLARNGRRAEVVLGDGLAAVPGRRFTLIASNPPFHEGYGVSTDATEAFIHEAREALTPGGRLVIVANRFLPYERAMGEAFGTVTTMASTAQYRVLGAQAPELSRPPRRRKRL